MNGYQAGVLCALGCQTGDKYSVRCVDRWYCDVVQPIFGAMVYPVSRSDRDKPQYTIKSASVSGVDLDDVTDTIGFCRAYIEIHGVLGMNYQRRRNGMRRKCLRLRVYGDQAVLTRLMEWLPAKPKKIQSINNRVGEKYTGSTYAIYYQSQVEIKNILKYIYGFPRNEDIWNQWDKLMKEECPLEPAP